MQSEISIAEEEWSCVSLSTTMPLAFHSARLTYRAMGSEDLEVLYAAFNDPDIWEPISAFGFGPRAENFKETMKKWAETGPLFVIAVDSQTGEFVGYTSLRFDAPPAMRDGELGIVVSKSHWGKGYGTEMVSWTVAHAFKFMNLHRVSLGTFAGNEKALKMYKKVCVDRLLRSASLVDFIGSGFVQEGIKRRARFCDGRWGDIILMSILEDEFFATEAGETT
jgi:RimJ/RimL family protein N-acetyltransferase